MRILSKKKVSDILDILKGTYPEAEYITQQIAHSTSQATDHRVLLDGDDAAGLSRRGHDEILI